MTSKSEHILDDPQGYRDKDGNYVPTEEEVRHRWPDLKEGKDLSRDDFRMKIWRNPVVRNLVPFFTAEEARAKQLGSAKSRSSRIQKYKEAKEEKATILQMFREELHSVDDEDYDPYKLLQLRSKMAVLEEDWDKVEELAKTMLEFTKPKLARIDQKNENFNFGEASTEDMSSFIQGKMTYEEFLKKQKG